MRKGFTLIELLVVISIIALLSSVVLASLNAAREKGRLGAARQFAGNLERAAGDQAVGIWDFDEGSGLTIADRSGFGNDGSFTGAGWSTNTPLGHGSSGAFNGSTSWVDLGSSSALKITPPFAISAWIRADPFGGSGEASLFMNDSFRPNDTGNYLGVTFNVTSAYGLSLHYGDNTGGGSGNRRSKVSAGGVVPTGKWVHVAAVVEGPTQMTLFVDGTDIGGSYSGTGGAIAYSSAVARIGHRTNGGQFFDGLIDQVRFYNKALTASEVGKLYAESAPRYRVAAVE